MSPRRSPETLTRSRRIKEGGDLEAHAVPAALRAEGYLVVAADKSRGAFDHVAVKPGQLLVIGARLTKVTGTNPHFDDAEWDALWDFARATSRPGFDVVPLLATARHAAPPGKARCRCSLTAPDPVRYLRLTGPSSGRGSGRTPPWAAWTPDEVAAA